MIPNFVYQTFDDIFSRDCFPILAGFDVGHDEPNLTVPFGINTSFDTSMGKLLFNESVFG
ncbi:MAG: LD-carboxypeptidase [Desulfobacteraceae bacterium]|nr:hypothetical protein [Desulfobacteraceae bacterium]MBC2755072.1 LD-carboxypeptidase [Desulfobacteraceae bacterium]